MNNLEKRKKIEELLLNLEKSVREERTEELSKEEENAIGLIFNFKKYYGINHGKIDISNMDYLLILGAILSESVNYKNTVDLESGEIALFTYRKYKDIVIKILRLILGDSIYPNEKVDKEEAQN